MYEIKRRYDNNFVSSVLPDEEAYVIAIKKYACLAFVVKIRSEVDSNYYMPASLKKLFKIFFNIFGCVLKICDFVLDHLNVNVLGQGQSIIFHFHFHVTELDIDRNLKIRWYPVLGNSWTHYDILVNFGLLVLCLLACHYYLNVKLASYIIPKVNKILWGTFQKKIFRIKRKFMMKI